MGRWLLPAGLALALLPSSSPTSAQIGGELAGLEQRVLAHPDDDRARRELGEAYARRGFVEEAVAQELALLVRHPEEAEARGRVRDLISARMPTWFPAEVEPVGPFAFQILEVHLRDPANACGQASYRLLVSKAGFAAAEGQRHDRVHKWPFPNVEYGYVWAAQAKRWVLKARVHWARQDDQGLAQDGLKALLALWCVAYHHLNRDPAQPWRQPVELWLAEGGEPGARALGRDIYLYATGSPRPGQEWWRELMHEYGHIAVPGIGGFAGTDDPWVNGELGELLFPKWLARGEGASLSSVGAGAAERDSSSMSWLPWSLPLAERLAAVRRQELIAQAADSTSLTTSPQPDPTRLRGHDEKAKDYFLGLALRVEASAGPRFLAEALARCPKDNPDGFVKVVEQLAKERGVEVWGR